MCHDDAVPIEYLTEVDSNGAVSSSLSALADTGYLLGGFVGLSVAPGSGEVCFGSAIVSDCVDSDLAGSVTLTAECPVDTSCKVDVSTAVNSATATFNVNQNPSCDPENLVVADQTDSISNSWAEIEGLNDLEGPPYFCYLTNSGTSISGAVAWIETDKYPTGTTSELIQSAISGTTSAFEWTAPTTQGTAVASYSIDTNPGASEAYVDCATSGVTGYSEFQYYWTLSVVDLTVSPSASYTAGGPIGDSGLLSCDTPGTSASYYDPGNIAPFDGSAAFTFTQGHTYEFTSTLGCEAYAGNINVPSNPEFPVAETDCGGCMMCSPAQPVAFELLGVTYYTAEPALTLLASFSQSVQSPGPVTGSHLDPLYFTLENGAPATTYDFLVNTLPSLTGSGPCQNMGTEDTGCLDEASIVASFTAGSSGGTWGEPPVFVYPPAGWPAQLYFALYDVSSGAVSNWVPVTLT